MTEIETILTELKQLEIDYKPSRQTVQHLHERNLVLFVAPVAAGKSTLMNELAARDTRFSRISGFTTRETRSNDEPGMYRYIPHDTAGLAHIRNLAAAGELVQFAIHPTTGRVYGSEPEDYPNEFNCGDILGHAVQSLRDLPVNHSYTFGLVCNPAQWVQRVLDRYEMQDPELEKRLAEARLNIHWSRRDPQTIVIDNSNGNLEHAIHEVIAQVTSVSPPAKQNMSEAVDTALDMLTAIDELYASVDHKI